MNLRNESMKERDDFTNCKLIAELVIKILSRYL